MSRTPQDYQHNRQAADPRIAEDADPAPAWPLEWPTTWPAAPPDQEPPTAVDRPIETELGIAYCTRAEARHAGMSIAEIPDPDLSCDICGAYDEDIQPDKHQIYRCRHCQIIATVYDDLFELEDYDEDQEIYP